MTFTYALDDPAAKKPGVRPADLTPTDAMWAALAARFDAEDGMTPYPAHKLRARWDADRAACIIHDGAIVLYVGVTPVYDDAIRERLRHFLGVDEHRLPHATVYRGVSGWTHPDWRRRGLGVAARRPFYGQLLHERALYVGTTSGIGATPIWSRLGWQVLPWEQFAFVAALDGWYDPANLARFYTPGSGWATYTPTEPWNGPSVSPFEDTDHDWGRYAHLGVSNPALAHDLNTAFETAAGGGLPHWQSALKYVGENPA